MMVTLGTSASTTALKNLPPRLMTPFVSSSTPGMAPGVSTTNTKGRLNESQNRMKPAALSEASLPTAPDMCIGWLAMTPTGLPSTRANAVIMEGLRWSAISKTSPSSKIRSRTSCMS
ncbi:Uncharacterised protein [Mycobacteroides abscessus subsp. massiliense]|nr:Uncharacterised protein [Mycobacteroides abscessus subsp. massiliense]